MIVYSDTLTENDLYEAALRARDEFGQDIWIDEISSGRSRKRNGRITFYAKSMNGRRARNGRPGRAASWTAYGYLIAELFRRDSEAIIGIYNSPTEFHEICSHNYGVTGESIDFLNLV